MLHQNKGVNQERRHKIRETGDPTEEKNEGNPLEGGEGHIRMTVLHQMLKTNSPDWTRSEDVGDTSSR